MTPLTTEQLETLAHELAADADGMRSLAWMRAHIRGWTPEVQQEAFQQRCAPPSCHSTEVVALTGGPEDKCLSNGDSWEDSTTRVVDVLCQCGWGLLSVPEEHVPNFCPECDFELHTTPEVLPDDPDLWHGGCAPEGFRARCGLPSYSDNPTPTEED